MDLGTSDMLGDLSSVYRNGISHVSRKAYEYCRHIFFVDRIQFWASEEINKLACVEPLIELGMSAWMLKTSKSQKHTARVRTCMSSCWGVSSVSWNLTSMSTPLWAYNSLQEIQAPMTGKDGNWSWRWKYGSFPSHNFPFFCSESKG